MPAKSAELAVEQLEQTIHLIRGHKVLLDRDLAVLYGVSTSNFNKAVRRNIERFPSDFMFQLTREEAERSRFQFGILNAKRRGTNVKYRPCRVVFKSGQMRASKSGLWIFRVGW